MKTKIALIGYGKMGKQIEELIQAGQQADVVLRLSKSNKADLNVGNLQKADVAIEFTEPASAWANLRICIDAGLPVVCGTTGWSGQLAEVKEYCMANNGALLWAPNFSIGVNLFFELNVFLASMMSSQLQYAPTITEIHHVHKKDAPSGTGIRIAEGITGTHAAYKSWTLGQSKSTDSIPVLCERTGEVPGTHIVNWHSESDKISIAHEAFSRKGFAEGALQAALWLKGRKGIFTMKDFISSALSANQQPK